MIGSSSTADEYGPCGGVASPPMTQGIVDARLGHGCEQLVEVVAIADHPRGQVHGDGVPERAQPRRDLDAVVDPVFRRARDRQPDGLRQLCRFLFATGEGHDLEARPVGHSFASTSGVPYVWKLSIVCTPQYWPRARSADVQTIGSKSGS